MNFVFKRKEKKSFGFSGVQENYYFSATAHSPMTAAMQEECDLPSSLLLPGRPCMLHPPAGRHQHTMALRANVAGAHSCPHACPLTVGPGE